MIWVILEYISHLTAYHRLDSLSTQPTSLEGNPIDEYEFGARYLRYSWLDTHSSTGYIRNTPIIEYENTTKTVVASSSWHRMTFFIFSCFPNTRIMNHSSCFRSNNLQSQSYQSNTFIRSRGPEVPANWTLRLPQWTKYELWTLLFHQLAIPPKR